MKKLILILICGLFICSGASAQKIKGVNSFFPTLDSIEITREDINYLLKNSIVICAKADTLDDEAIVKTVEIVCRDTAFKFVGAYMESSPVSPSDFRNYKVEENKKVMHLDCAFVLVDNGKLYETFELDSLGRKQFEGLLNRAPLKCMDYWK